MSGGSLAWPDPIPRRGVIASLVAFVRMGEYPRDKLDAKGK